MNDKQLIGLLKELHLPMFREYYAEFAEKALAEDVGYAQYGCLGRPSLIFCNLM